MKDDVGWIHGGLVLCNITNEACSISKSQIEGGVLVHLIIGDNLHSFMLSHTNARIHHTKFDTDCRSLSIPSLSKNLN